MKKRTGFVSNSSSSSFIIDVHTSWESVVDVFTREWGHWRFDKIRKDLEEELVSLEKERSKNKEFTTEDGLSYFLQLTEDGYKSRKEKYTIALEKLDSCPLETLLIVNDVDFSKKKNKVVFEKWVPMFNEYTDMGDFLLNLLLSLKASGIDFSLDTEADY